MNSQEEMAERKAGNWEGKSTLAAERSAAAAITEDCTIVGRRLEILVITVLGSEDGEGGAGSEGSEERGMSRGEEGDEEPEEGERRDRSHPPIQRPQD
ncbi:hypothetical protein GW17_00025095 [Ensete ventricosum]|nr:hypothetical protein GW17_00025095 [Ensete ventricosum]RZS23992.1 hypothetical protein BHM03_00057006 [Ensete ventricosum]